MKVKETRRTGFGGSHIQTRVRELAPAEPQPQSSEQVPDETPVYEWGNEPE